MTRLERACAAVAEAELDALVVTDLVNIVYLTGFVGSSAAVVLRPEGAAFLSDSRYYERACAEVPEAEHHKVAQGLLDEVKVAIPDGATRVGFEADEMTVTRRDQLAASLPSAIELVPTQGTVEQLRAIKDAGELAKMAEVAAIADETIRSVLSRGLVGRTELEVATDFELELRRLGAEQASFPLICLAGPNGSSPHGRPSGAPIPRDVLVVMDFGVSLDGYCSDGTRTFATGDVGDDARRVYELVRHAQASALEAIAPGTALRKIDAIARDIITAGGHGEDFGHGTGHGVGLQVQESPRLTARAEGVLETGNVVTVEPGIYVPGRFGVRIEDLVVVTEDGHRVLSSQPKELQIVG